MRRSIAARLDRERGRARMQRRGSRCGDARHQRRRHRERALHRRVVQPAVLETADPVDARLGQGEVELVVVAGHRLHRSDQVAVRVVEAEAVVDVDRGDVEAHARPGRHLVRLQATRRTGRRSPSRPSARTRHRSRRAGRTARSRPRPRRSRPAAQATACAASSRRRVRVRIRPPSPPARRSRRTPSRAAARARRRRRRSRSADHRSGHSPGYTEPERRSSRGDLCEQQPPLARLPRLRTTADTFLQQQGPCIVLRSLRPRCAPHVDAPPAISV